MAKRFLYTRQSAIGILNASLIIGLPIAKLGLPANGMITKRVKGISRINKKRNRFSKPGLVSKKIAELGQPSI